MLVHASGVTTVLKLYPNNLLPFVQKKKKKMMNLGWTFLIETCDERVSCSAFFFYTEVHGSAHVSQ